MEVSSSDLSHAAQGAEKTGLANHANAAFPPSSSISIGNTMSQPTTLPASAPAASPPPSRRGWLRMAFIGAPLLLIVGPCVATRLPYEPLLWQAAPIAERYLDAHASEPPNRAAMQQALSELEALSKGTTSLEMLHLRAKWREDLGDYQGAAEDWERIVAADPSAGLTQRGNAYFQAGRMTEGLADWVEACKSKEESGWGVQVGPAARNQARRLNQLAYGRAVANLEIETGLKEIELALQIAQALQTLDLVNALDSPAGVDTAGFLDTRGFLYYRQGKNDLALEDLDRAVDSAEKTYPSWEQVFEAKKAEIADPRYLRVYYREFVQRNLAVLVYHRGLAHQALNNQAQAEKDFARVRELGFEPNKHLF